MILTNRLNLLKRINLYVSLYCLVFKDQSVGFASAKRSVLFCFCLSASQPTFTMISKYVLFVNIFFKSFFTLCLHYFVCFVRLAYCLTGILSYHVLCYYVNYYFKMFFNVVSISSAFRLAHRLTGIISYHESRHCVNNQFHGNYLLRSLGAYIIYHGFLSE